MYGVLFVDVVLFRVDVVFIVGGLDESYIIGEVVVFSCYFVGFVKDL